MAKKHKQQLGLIEAAAQKFFAGDDNAALSLCKSILKNNPKDTNALNLSGIIYDKQDKKKQAIKFFLAAIKLTPNNPEINTNLATTYLGLDELDNAEKYLNKALSVAPDYSEAQYNLGNIHYKRNEFEQAKGLYEKTLKKNSHHVRALNNLADIVRKEGNIDRSISLYQQVLNIAPNFIESLLGLASINYDNKNYQPTEKLLRKIIQLDPNHVRAYYLLGASLYNSDNDSNEALSCLKTSLKLDENQADVKNAIAASLLYKNRLSEALEYIESALITYPDYSEAYNTKGIILHELGDFDASKVAYEKSIECNPNSAESLNNYGHLLNKFSEPRSALSYFNKAIEINPNHRNAKTNLAITKLLLGEFHDAWDYYRYRPSVKLNEAEFCPDKTSLNLSGRSVLLVKDQGIGDELFFLRFLPKFLQQGVKTSYHCCHKLLPILARTSLFENVSFGPVIKSGYDHVFSVGDLPYICDHQSEAETPTPFQLTSRADLTQEILERLATFGPPPYIGFSWQAGGLVNNKKISALIKNFDISELQKILSNIDGTLISLQRNPNVDEINSLSHKLNRPILNLDEYSNDLERMLSLLDILDHYIAVSNTNIHLRAGLNKSSHVLIPNPPEWRWMEEVKHNHWFPHCNIYRQKKDGSWNEAVEGILLDIANV